MSDPDPLLQPFRLKHLTLRNRVMSILARAGVLRGRHAQGALPAVPRREGQGWPGDDDDRRARRSCRRTARRRSATSTPTATRSCRGSGRMTDEVHEHGAAAMIQISHLGRRTGWGQDDWLPVRRAVGGARTRAPGHPEGGRGLGHRPHRRPLRRRRRADAGRRHGRHRDRGVRAPVRPVLVAGHQPAQPTSTAARSRTACVSAGGCCTAIRERVGPEFIVGIRMAVDERIEGGIDMPIGLEPAPSSRGRRADRLRQRHPRQRRRRGRCSPR